MSVVWGFLWFNSNCKTIYTKKSIVDFRQCLYMPAKQKFALHLPHAKILVNHQCGNTWQEVFKHRAAYQDVLCHIYYSERVVASFSHKIKPEYYSVNLYMSIKSIGLEHLSTTDQETSSSYLHSCKLHYVFHSLLIDNRKQDASTTAAHIKIIIQLLKNIKPLFFWSEYHMREYRKLWISLKKSYIIILIVNIFRGLKYNYWLWCQCTGTHQRSFIRS